MKNKKNADRHTGTRENVWFPWKEHEAMLKGMAAIHEQNKSNFIRTAVRNLVDAINEEQSKKGAR